MKILVAEDDPVSRRFLQATLAQWGHEVQTVADGAAAWTVMQSPEPPLLAILDWMMPEMDGVEVCRQVRRAPRGEAFYLILLTARDDKTDLLVGLDAGADEYLTKPIDNGLLRARLKVAARLLQLQLSLTERVHELEDALTRVKQLQGMLPICAWCKNVRDDQNYWQTVEDYVAAHTEARFTHGICPACMQREKARLNK